MDKAHKVSSITSFVIIVILLIVTISSFTFAYFTADLQTTDELNISAVVSDEYSPVFTASVAGDLSLNVTTADMLEGDTLNGSVVADEASSLISVKMIGGGRRGENTITYRCTYNMYWTDTNSAADAYVPSSGIGNNLEYSLAIYDDNDNVVYPERQINPENSGVALLTNQSITSSGELTEVNYIVTARIYNLNVPQTIYDHVYTSVINVADISCSEVIS